MGREGWDIYKKHNNCMNNDFKTAQVHIRVSNNTRYQWLEICDLIHGNTQSQVFRKLIEKLHSSIEETTNINNYD